VLGGRETVSGVVCEVRREDDSIPSFDRTKPQRGPQVAAGHAT
jgi:hypothetical protein